jgi:hypothetical protein
MINIKTCFGMSDAKLHGNKRAARPASFSLSHLHPYVIRLGRIALEALSMATLLTHKKEIPSWLGVCIVLAEETCVSAMIPRCISDQRFVSDTLPQKAQTIAAEVSSFQTRCPLDLLKLRPRVPFLEFLILGFLLRTFTATS